MTHVSQSGQKTLIIGLDGATFDYLTPWVKRGYLPHLAQLIDCGISGELLSTIPPFTIPAWSSFMTGKNPGKHSVISFFERSSTAYQMEEVGQFVNATSIKSQTFWQLLSQANKKLGVINVPMTYPPRDINGFMITGMMTPSQANVYTFPPQLAASLEGYIIDLEYLHAGDHFDLQNIPNKRTLLADISQMLRKRVEVCRQLMTEYDWDCFMTVFTSTDRLCHFFWDYLMEEEGLDPQIHNDLGAFLTLLDQSVGDLVELAGNDTTVIVMSDHGFGAAPSKRLNINNWLTSLGVLNLNHDLDRVTSLSYLNLQLGQLPSLKNLIKRMVPENLRQKIQEQDRGKTSWLIDWKRTKAYGVPLYANVCGLWINQAGVKQAGIVMPGAEYNEFRTRLFEQAQNIIDEDTGKPIVTAAYFREMLYHGPYTERFPDIILVLDPAYFCSTTIMQGGIISEVPNYHYVGEHRPEGVFIASGPVIQAGKLTKHANILDLAPTILHLLGVAIPEDMDGRVLDEIFIPSFLQTNPPKHVPVVSDSMSDDSTNGSEIYSEDEEAEIRERLRALGYLN